MIGLKDISLFILGAYAVLDLLDWKFKIPFWSKWSFERNKKLMAEIFQKEQEFLLQNDHRRIEHLLQQLRIKRDQLDILRSQLLRLINLPIKNLADAKQFIRETVKADPVFVDQSALPPEKKPYDKVCYYIDFRHICYCPSMLAKLSSAMVHLILEEVGESISQIDKIAVPCKGNILLGYEVSRLLEKPFVFIRSDMVVQRDRFWEGELRNNDNCIVVHDVTVQAIQLESAVDTIRHKAHANISKIFTILKRKEYKPEDKLQPLGVKLCSLLDIDDIEIQKLR
ncbi:MAG: hypothetical protein PHY02_01235 [Phycisphaerae bacterium]|nr:hypothetical protein [Phycisphaerae bacterium]